MVHTAIVPEEKVADLSAAMIRRDRAIMSLGYNQTTLDEPRKGLVYLSDNHCWLTDGLGNKLGQKPIPVHRIDHSGGFWEGFQPGPDVGFEWESVNGARLLAVPYSPTGTYNKTYHMVTQPPPGDATCWYMEVLEKDGVKWEEKNP